MAQNKAFIPPRLPDPPEEYDPNYMRDLVRRLEQVIAQTQGIQTPRLIDENRQNVWRIVETTAAGAIITDDT